MKVKKIQAGEYSIISNGNQFNAEHRDGKWTVKDSTGYIIDVLPTFRDVKEYLEPSAPNKSIKSYRIKHIGGMLHGVEQVIKTDCDYIVGELYKKTLTRGSYRVLELVDNGSR